MASNVNNTIPITGTRPVASQIRTNFATIKTELETLQSNEAIVLPKIPEIVRYVALAFGAR